MCRFAVNKPLAKKPAFERAPTHTNFSTGPLGEIGFQVCVISRKELRTWIYRRAFLGGRGDAARDRSFPLPV